MKIVVVAESFLPSLNGVTNSVLQVADQLMMAGHHVDVLAAAPSRGMVVSTQGCTADVTWLPSLAVPGYSTQRWSAPGVPKLRSLLKYLAPEVVHLAAPFVLGWDAVRASRSLGVPVVAVYQTDLPAYAARYGLAPLTPMVWRRVRDIHGTADRTLAPSSWSATQLSRQQVPRVHRWARGVDCSTFHPDCRDDALHQEWASQGHVVVGYVGRLAAEKQVEDLRALQGLDGVRLVVVGDGPKRSWLERMLPAAHFCGGKERRAFGVAARRVVQDRSWSRSTQILLRHYREVSAPDQPGRPSPTDSQPLIVPPQVGRRSCRSARHRASDHRSGVAARSPGPVLSRRSRGWADCEPRPSNRSARLNETSDHQCSPGSRSASRPASE